MSKKKKETIKNVKPKKKIDSSVYLEYSERSYLAVNILDTVLVEHTVYEQHPSLAKKVDQIISDLADFHQLVGNLMFKKVEQEEKADNKADVKT